MQEVRTPNLTQMPRKIVPALSSSRNPKDSLLATLGPGNVKHRTRPNDTQGKNHSKVDKYSRGLACPRPGSVIVQLCDHLSRAVTTRLGRPRNKQIEPSLLWGRAQLPTSPTKSSPLPALLQVCPISDATASEVESDDEDVSSGRV